MHLLPGIIKCAVLYIKAISDYIDYIIKNEFIYHPGNLRLIKNTKTTQFVPVIYTYRVYNNSTKYLLRVPGAALRKNIQLIVRERHIHIYPLRCFTGGPKITIIFNPFRAPNPLRILNTSHFVPKNGFPVVKGLIVVNNAIDP